ncbi:His/Gly/Thr/Pro-type tRNA ligase C-terminal domain-containing protein [Bacillus pumilus]
MDLEYGKKVEERLQVEGVGVEVERGDEKMGYKIREGEMEKMG